MRSRKLWITSLLSVLLYVAPIIYKLIGVSDNVALTALWCVAGIGSAYLGFNVLQKKILSNGEDY